MTNPVIASSDLLSLLADSPAPATFNVDLIFDADGNPVSGFTIVGKNSSQYQTVEKIVRVANIMRSANRKSAIDSATESGAETLVRTVDANQRMTALSVIIGWYGFVINGADAPFDSDTVAKMLDKYPTWQTKVLMALEVDSNFLKV